MDATSKVGGLGGSVAPLTPEQLAEQRVNHVGSTSGRSLASSFNQLALSNDVSDVSSSKASSAADLDSKETGIAGSRSSSDELEAWTPAHFDEDEPILQHNDERFCLLPVK